MISIVNYISMAAIIYNDPVVNLKAWEEMYEINHGVGLFWSPEDYILIPFPMFHNYVRVIQKIKPDEIKEYNSKDYTVTPVSGKDSAAFISTTQEGTMVKTDTLKVSSNVENINIGLVLNGVFDLELNKYISKIITEIITNYL